MAAIGVAEERTMNTAMKRLGTVTAGALRKGDQMVDKGTKRTMTVMRVEPCSDGALRVHHSFGECRMTASILVRVMH
jgi:hypothetical protein